MKRTLLIVISGMLILLLSASIAMAAKPMDVINHSNGFPSGQHFNLNLHGRDCLTWTGDPTGNVVIIPLYSDDCFGDATIQYLSNKKNRNKTELVVLDGQTEPFDGDAAQVYLPYNIVDGSDNVTKSAGGYYVFGRALGTPNNSISGDESNLLIYPATIIKASDATDNETWPWPLPEDDTNVDLVAGLITSQGNLFTPTVDGVFERFDPDISSDPNQKGKGKKTGKSMGVDITDLFMWEGYVTDNLTLDFNGNGYFDDGDAVSDNATPCQGLYTTVEPWLVCLESQGLVEYVEPMWIFDVAEMMITGQEVENDGTRNFQIRFYPVATTEFER